MLGLAAMFFTILGMMALLLIWWEWDDNRCVAKGGYGRHCRFPFHCRNMGYHTIDFPPDEPRQVPTWKDGA